MTRVLITGGAGFVGAALAVRFKEHVPGVEVVAFDNLRRRGSELNLAEFKRRGIVFQHGDIRRAEDLLDLEGRFDLFIDASAEPSVQSGLTGSPSYVLQTNLGGTLNCLEFARTRCGAFAFLSTSRVYSIAPLKAIRLDEGTTRFEIAATQELPGVTSRGIGEAFPTHLPRSYYGASKLAAEQIVQEYAESSGLATIINRCGVIAGPGQFGRVDQGVFTLWVAHHLFDKPLTYTGFGGTGKQVRDLLHPSDLFGLLTAQWNHIDRCGSRVFNVGGGATNAVSLRDYTALCASATGRVVTVAEDPRTNAVDIPLFVTDHTRATDTFQWRPTTSVPEIVTQIASWISEHQAQLRALY